MAEARKSAQARWLKVASIIGSDVICRTCGANLATYADVCTASLAEPCEGFLTIEKASADPSPSHKGEQP